MSWRSPRRQCFPGREEWGCCGQAQRARAGGSDGKFYRIGGKDEAKQVAHATGKRGAWLYILSGSCPAAQEGFVACLVRIAPNTTTSCIANALREPTRHTHAVQEARKHHRLVVSSRMTSWTTFWGSSRVTQAKEVCPLKCLPRACSTRVQTPVIKCSNQSLRSASTATRLCISNGCELNFVSILRQQL